MVNSKDAFDELMHRNVEPTHLKFAYLEKKLAAYDLLEELLVRRRLSMDELKLYFLFLREWLTPRTEKSIQIFFSQKELLRVLANDSREILELRRKAQAEQMKQAGSQAQAAGRVKEIRFLTTHQNDLLRLFNSLMERGLIIRQEHKIEREYAEPLFIGLPEKPQRATWNTSTFQPGIERALMPGEKPGEVREVACCVAVRPVMHGTFPMASPEVAEVLSAFLLPDLGESLQCSSEQNFWPRQRRLMNILTHLSLTTEEFLYLSKEETVKQHLDHLQRMKDGGAPRMLEYLDLVQLKMNEVVQEVAKLPMHEGNMRTLAVMKELDEEYERRFPDDPVIEGEREVSGFWGDVFFHVNQVPWDEKKSEDEQQFKIKPLEDSASKINGGDCRGNKLKKAQDSHDTTG